MNKAARTFISREQGLVRLARCARVAALMGLLAAGTARATIDRLVVCGQEFLGRGKWVPAYRGSTTLIKVFGFGVDFATRVDTTIPDATATIIERKGGSGTYVVIRLSTPDGGKLLGAQVSLRYAVEVAGPDTFTVDVYPVPKVESLSFQSGSGVSVVNGIPNLTAGDPHILVVKGRYLDDLDVVSSSQGLRNLSVTLRQSGEMRVSLTPAAAGSYSIDQGLFRVNAAGCKPSLGNFTISFTAVDRPRTPTPTVTPTATPTRPPLSLPPRLTPVAPPRLVNPTPTPMRKK